MKHIRFSSNKHLTIPCILLIVFGLAPFYVLLLYFNYGFDDVGIPLYRIYFGYLWLSLLAATIYWMYHGVVKTTSEYVLAVVGLILSGIFFIVLTTN